MKDQKFKPIIIDSNFIPTGVVSRAVEVVNRAARKNKMNDSMVKLREELLQLIPQFIYEASDCTADVGKRSMPFSVKCRTEWRGNRRCYQFYIDGPLSPDDHGLSDGKHGDHYYWTDPARAQQWCDFYNSIWEIAEEKGMEIANEIISGS